MIPITDLSWQSLSWQAQLNHSIRTPAALADALNLDVEQVTTDFPVNVPLSYLQRMRPGDPLDPLLLQVLTTSAELSTEGLESPLQEEAFSKGLGLIQKYQGRALVVTTGACAIHCRYCFRRHFPYEEHQPSTENWLQLVQKLRSNLTLREVILSGGDPLMLNDRRFTWILNQLSAIPHLTTIRLHTRMPVVLPARITEALLQTLGNHRCQIVLVTHVNHGNELDDEVARVCRQLAERGVTLLNQSVLLRGINDSDSTLINLSQRLHDCGILPYYLHLMDPVQGAGHFDVPESEAIGLIAAIRAALPGYLVPRLAKEIPFSASKTVVA